MITYNSQFEIAFSASTRCLCVYVYALVVWETLCKFAKVNHDLTTQL